MLFNFHYFLYFYKCILGILCCSLNIKTILYYNLDNIQLRILKVIPKEYIHKQTNEDNFLYVQEFKNHIDKKIIASYLSR